MADIHVRSNEEVWNLLDQVIQRLDETKSDRKELEARVDKDSTEVRDAIARLTETEETLGSMKARLDEMDKQLPRGGKIYQPADGSAPKSQLRQECARFILDAMSYELTGKTPFGSDAFQRAVEDLGQSYKDSGADNVGGYLVPDLYSQEILRVAENYGICRRLFRQIPMRGYQLHMPTHESGPEVEWVYDNAATPKYHPNDEGVGPTDKTQAKFNRVTLKTNRLMAVDTLSIEITEWAIPVIADFLIDVFAEKLAQAEDRAGLIGDGTHTYGGFTGVVGASGVNSVYLNGGAVGSGSGTGSNTAFADLRYTDLVNVIDAPNEFASEQGVWVMSNSIVNLLRTLREDEAAGTGRPLWSSFGTEMQANAPGTILGRPLYRSAVMNKQSDSGGGKHILAYGNFRNALMGTSLGGLSIAFSEHADFRRGNIVMRVMERVGFLTTLGDTFAVLKTQTP